MSNHAYVARVFVACLYAVFLAACSGEPATAPDAAAPGHAPGHTSHSITLESGRVVTIPEDAAPPNSSGEPVLDVEWVRSTFTRSEAAEIQAACVREQRILAENREPNTFPPQLQRPLRWLCRHAGNQRMFAE